MDDRQAIIDVTIAYCWALDSRDWDALDEVFAPYATAELGRHLHGIDAIKERVREALEPLDVSQHIVATHQVTVDDDTARSRCYLHAQHVVGDATFVVGGRYEDRLARTADGWRIVHRDLIVMWTAGDPSVLRRT